MFSRCGKDAGVLRGVSGSTPRIVSPAGILILDVVSNAPWVSCKVCRHRNGEVGARDISRNVGADFRRRHRRSDRIRRDWLVHWPGSLGGSVHAPR